MLTPHPEGFGISLRLILVGGWVGVLPFFYGSKAMESLAWLCPMSIACFSLRINWDFSNPYPKSSAQPLPFFPEAVPITIFAQGILPSHQV